MVDIISMVGMILLGVIGIALVILVLAGIVYVSRYEVGIKTKKMFGVKMPQGQVIARKGEIGIQADTLMPGLYWFNPITWKIEKEQITVVKETEVGTIESIDGQSIPTGRLLGDAVESNQFQDAKMFLENGGNKGPQIDILRPGAYRINTRAFTVTKHAVTKIPEESIGIAVAVDGQPLPSGYIIAPKPENNEHKFYQNGPEFIKAKGYRGPQLDTLQPGEYYINPLLFEVKVYEVAEVPPGYVAVLRSNIGLELAKSSKPSEMEQDSSFKQEVHEKDEVVLTTDVNQRGIWEKPVAPGIYNLNFLALTPFLVPTSAVTIDWAAGTDLRTEEKGIIEKTVGKLVGRRVVTTKDRDESDREYGRERKQPPREEVETEKATEFFKFSQLLLTSKDGFLLEADVRMIIRIRPQHASFIIARFGSVSNLIEQIVHPLIDSSFRNKAGEKKAIDFIQSRTQLQKEALEKAREEFEKYYVEAQNLLISYIKVDASLLKTQTDKEIAIQQQEQFKEQAAAQEENIAVQEKTARAAKQRDVIDAALSIKIKEDMADARRKEAFGESDAIKSLADGEAYKNRETGKGLADAYKAQSVVIGPEKLAMIKIMEQVNLGKIKIVPDFLVTGGGDKGDGNLFNVWMATMLADKQKEKYQENK